MRNTDTPKKILLIVTGMLIVFVINAVINPQVALQPIPNNYPLRPFSAEMILITSAGQSTDAYIFHDIANDYHLNNHFMPEVDTYDLRAYSSIVFVVGYSDVGMMLNDVTYASEVKRIRKILQTAEAEQLPVVVTYLGGDARRSPKTDALLELVCNAADFIILTTDQEQSEFTNALTNNGSIPMTAIQNVDQLSIPLASIFK